MTTKIYTMNSCNTLEELKEHFQRRFKDVEMSQMFYAARNDPTFASLVGDCVTSYNNIKQELKELRAAIDKCKEQNKQLAEMTKTTQKLNCTVMHMLNNLPVHLPSRRPVAAHYIMQQRDAQRTPQATHRLLADYPAAVPKLPPANLCSSPQLPTPQSHTVAKASAPVPLSEKQLARAPVTQPPSTHRQVPVIQPLTVKQFESVPRYMITRHHIKYDEMNEVIANLNKAYHNKYSIVFAPLKTLNAEQKKKRASYKRENTDATKDLCFITEVDMLEVSSKLRMTKRMQSVFTILRHCQLIKEERSHGVVRFVYVDHHDFS